MKSGARFILSKSTAIEQHDKLKEYADLISYSFKTNRDVGLELRDNTDCMFSVHSVDSVKQLNCPKRIWYFAQAWDKAELNELINLEINNFVVDNINDLTILQKHAKDYNLLLRMRLKENTIHTGKHFVYGMYSEEIKNLIPKLRKDKNIKKLGLHFHRKTQNISEWSLKYELEQILPKKIWKSIDFLNIGGGLPAEYKNFRAEVIDNIFKKIKEVKAWLNTELIIEPGRFISAASVKLEANIVNIYDNNIVVDCSVYNSAMDTFVTHIRLKIEGELEKGTPYTIKGKTPDSIDILRYRVFLKNPKIGDKITFLNAGAYNYATDFCGLLKLPTIVE